jgi:hypothetical protein
MTGKVDAPTEGVSDCVLVMTAFPFCSSTVKRLVLSLPTTTKTGAAASGAAEKRIAAREIARVRNRIMRYSFLVT